MEPHREKDHETLLELASTVRHLSDASKELSKAVGKNTEALNEHRAQLAVLFDRSKQTRSNWALWLALAGFALAIAQWVIPMLKHTKP